MDVVETWVCLDRVKDVASAFRRMSEVVKSRCCSTRDGPVDTKDAVRKLLVARTAVVEKAILRMVWEEGRD